jgi:hypothetical protein
MKPFNNSFATLKLREEQSSFDEQNVTGADGAYNASLHASKKKRNPFTEDELSGYKKLKGFRPGHTKDTGGFQYSDLWGVNEGFEVGDSAKVTMKGNINYNKIGEIVDVTKDGKYYTLQFKNNTKAIYHESDISTPAKVKDFQDKPSLPLDENYSRFKKETVTRSKEQQMHEAMKLVRKKLYEAEKVLDYVKTMKEELGLQEYKSHTSKLMEKLQVSISEIYKKYKKIK